MSTYLVAFVVCDYNHTTTQTKKGISVSVYAPTQLISQAQFALDTATIMMDHYEDFFGIDYPLPKQGMWYIFHIFLCCLYCFQLKYANYNRLSISDQL